MTDYKLYITQVRSALRASLTLHSHTHTFTRSTTHKNTCTIFYFYYFIIYLMDTTNEIMNVLDGKTQKSEFTIYDNADILKISTITDITKEECDNYAVHVKKIVKKKPVKTRKNMSKYEFAATITKLANYLDTLDSLEQYVDEANINEFVNNSELAYHLLMDGKFDAIINRLSYEEVNFSQLKINPLWINLLENYFKRNHESLKVNCYEPFDKALETL